MKPRKTQPTNILQNRYHIIYTVLYPALLMLISGTSHHQSTLKRYSGYSPTPFDMSNDTTITMTMEQGS